MKRKKILIIVCSIIMVHIMVFGIVIFIMSATNHSLFLQGKILANCNSFCESWDMGRPEVDESEKKIKIGFSLNVSNNRGQFEKDVAKTALACEEISNYLFSDKFHFCEEGYKIDFCFSDDKLFHLDVQNVEPGMRNIYLSIPDDDFFPKSRYNEWYPYTEVLDVTSIDDDTIEVIKNFTNLKRIRTGPNLTDEQKDRILSTCPDVEIDARIYYKGSPTG